MKRLRKASDGRARLKRLLQRKTRVETDWPKEGVACAIGFDIVLKKDSYTALNLRKYILKSMKNKSNTKKTDNPGCRLNMPDSIVQKTKLIKHYGF